MKWIICDACRGCGYICDGRYLDVCAGCHGKGEVLE